MPLILPNQPPKPLQPGVQFQVQQDGHAVAIVMQVTTVCQLGADQAAALANAIGQAAVQAKQVEQAVLMPTPLNVPNGVVR